MMRLNKMIHLLCWIILFEGVGFLLGLLTQGNIDPWYNHLHKSSLTPPGFVFGIVWTLLYALLAVIASMLSHSDSVSFKKMRVLFFLQILMNWIWTPLFFGLHWLIPSALWLLCLTGVNIIVCIEAQKTYQTIAWLLMPYLCWLVFASYLNVLIAVMN